MAFKHYLEEEDDKPYFTTNSLGYYYDKMEGFAEKVEQAAKVLNVTKEEIEKRIAERLQEWDGKLEAFDGSVLNLLSEWVDDGTLNHVIDEKLIDEKIKPLTLKIQNTATKQELANVVGITPEVFDTLTALKAMYPTGKDGVFVVREDGKWYAWKDGVFVPGGTYTASPLDKQDIYTLMDFPNPVPVTPTVSMTNLLTGNTNLWVGISGTVTEENGTITLTPTASGAQMTKTVSLVPDRKYWVKGAITSPHGKAYLYVSGTVGVYHSGSGNEENLSTVVTAVTGSTTIRVRDYSTENWQAIQARKIMIVDLTTIFGAGKEPNNSELVSLLSYNYPDLFFEATQTLSYPPEPQQHQILSYKETGMEWVAYESKGLLTQLTGKKIIWMGDSITEFGQAKLNVIAERTGAEVVNAGFGGCKLAYDNDPLYDWFTMTKLADAIHSGDWTGQIQNQVIGSDDNSVQVKRLVDMDWNTVDYLCIDYMANDFTGWVPPGEVTDTTRSSISGAVNYIVEKINSKYPHIQLIFFSPMFRSRQVVGDGKDSDNFPNGRGVYQIEQVDALIKAAKKNHCPVHDLYRNSGINLFNHHVYLADGLHPINPSGYEHVGHKQASFLLANT